MNKKNVRFGLKLIIAGLPFIVYAVIFVIFEPYNYWGLKRFDSGKPTTPLARVREYMRHPSDKIIIGDSRMNHFDLGMIESITGEKWANLATGGQCINLTYQMYEWASGHYPINKCLIDVSFYQLLEGYRSASAEPVFYVAEHPLVYISTYDYVSEAWNEMMYSFELKERVSFEFERNEEIDNLIVADNKYRDDLLEYALYCILPSVNDYEIDEESMKWISDICTAVDEDGGQMMILLPCVQESIWEYVIEPLNLETKIKEYHNRLLDLPVTIYDMEWLNEISQDQTVYSDGFHFKNSDYYQEFYTKDIFGTHDENVKIYYGKGIGNTE